MWNEEKLNEMLTTPSEKLVADIAKLSGDIMVLGASGKMGTTLCVLARKAVEKAGLDKKIYAVSTFSDEAAKKYLEENGVITVRGDLLAEGVLESLPEAENIIYMVGKKFGTFGNEWQTWAMNSMLPAYTVKRFPKARFVVFSSGNIYPLADVSTRGCTEETPPDPIGEYTQSCLARERTFEAAAHRFGTKVLIYRLNYSIDLHYGVLFDIASKVMRGEKISVDTAYFNVIWQGSANEAAIRALTLADASAPILNVTGPEKISVRETAEKFGRLLGKTPEFTGTERDTAYLNDASKMFSIFGYPSVSADTLIDWQAEWLLAGGRTLNKPTHFEERHGRY